MANTILLLFAVLWPAIAINDALDLNITITNTNKDDVSQFFTEYFEWKYTVWSPEAGTYH